MRQAAFRFDFFQSVATHVATRPDQTALAAIGPQGIESYSWSRLDREIRGLSRYLQDAGILPGDRVAILMENHPRWGVAFAAVQSAGAVVVPLDTVGSPAAAAAAADHAGVRFLIASSRFEDAARAVCEAAPSILGRLATEADWNAANAAASRDRPSPLVPRTLDDPLAILYTGGTTGKPKGVLLTQRNLYRSISDMLELFPLSPADRVLSVLPLFHVMPLLANLLAPLVTGATVLYLNQLVPQTLLDTFASQRITAFLCVPQFYYQMERRILDEVARQPAAKRALFALLLRISGFFGEHRGWQTGKMFFSAVHARFGADLRGFGTGGAYFNPKTARFFADLGFPLFQAYGLTESGGLAAAAPPDRNGGMTCGKAVAHCEIRILNPDASGAGEILIRGENVMQGYWRDPEATAAVIKDGWLHTGDLGALDSEGRLRLTGRVKDVIVLSTGKNIFPEELEQYFTHRCPALQEVCFVGLEGSEGAILHCVAVPNRERFNSSDPGLGRQVRREIAMAARDLPSYRRPRSLQITGEPLPRTTTRKLQRFRIREFAANAAQGTPTERSRAESADPTEREILALIRRTRASSKTAIDSETHLEIDLHFESLERVELIANVEKVFGVVIGAQSSADIHTVGDLVSTVRNGSAGTPRAVEWSDWTDLVRQPLDADERALADGYLRRRAFLETGWYAFGRVLALALRSVMKLRVHRAGEFPEPPFLICPNHLSYLDDPVIACSLPFVVFRRMFAVAGTKYFRGRVASWFISLFRILPIDEDRNLLKGLRMAKAGLEKKLSLVIFPEGTRSYDGNLQELRKGAAILACALGIPVVPVGLSGTFESWPRGRVFPRPHPVSISYGEAIRPLSGEAIESFNLRLTEAMAQEVRTARGLRN